MSVLTILTQGCQQELEELNLRCYAVNEGIYQAQHPKDSIDTDAFACLLERVVVFSHPLYGSSQKLANMALDLRHTEIHQANELEFTRYIVEHELLHLEGYATFRMWRYRNKLDMMMYCLIKKLKLTDPLLLY